MCRLTDEEVEYKELYRLDNVTREWILVPTIEFKTIQQMDIKDMTHEQIEALIRSNIR